MRRCVHRIFYRTVEMLLISMAAQLAAGQEPSTADGRFKAAVDGLVTSLSGKATLPAGWQKMTFASSAPLGGSQQGMHLCKLRQAEGKTSYVVLSERQGQLSAVMFGGVPVPDRLLSTLSVGANYTSRPPPSDFSVPTGLRMIGPIERPATPRLSYVSTSAISCGLASILLELQHREGVPLFVHYWGEAEYARAIAKCLDKWGNSQAATAVRDGIAQFPRRYSGERRHRYAEERRRAIRDGDFFEPVESTPPALNTRFQGGLVKDAVKLLDALFAMDRAFLTDRLFLRDRLFGLRREADNVSSIEMLTSDGALVSLLLDRRYLKNTDSVEAAIDLFTSTRGFRVQCERRAPRDVLAGDLPCLLLGPDSQAMVLVAVGPGESSRWGLVYIPETVVTLRKSAADLIVEEVAQTRPAATQVSGATPKSASEVRADLEKEIGISEDQHVVNIIRDPVFGPPSASALLGGNVVALPDALCQGAHVVDLEACESAWQALVLRNWQIRDNWDFDLSK